MITWSRFAGMKFHLVKPGQVSLYDYKWKLNFVPARQHSFPPGICLAGDYMIPVYGDEISPHPGGTDLILRLHVEIEFRPGKVGQFSTCHLFRSVCNFFDFFFVTMLVYEIENP